MSARGGRSNTGVSSAACAAWGGLPWDAGRKGRRLLPWSPARAPPICSQMHRDVSRWQGTEIADCGPDVSGLIELTPIGNDLLLARRRFSPLDDLWSLSPQGVPGAEPISVDQVMGGATAGFTLLAGSPSRVLVYDPRQSQWNLYVTQSSAASGAILGSAGQGQWPTGYWPANQDGGPWNHQFVGLENGNVLDRDLGDGSTRIWTVVSGADATSPTALVPSSSLVGGPHEHFRRGHRLVHLGPNRLLEWLPRPCPGAAPAHPCAGSDFNVWSYSLDAGAALNFHIVSSGFWPDSGPRATSRPTQTTCSSGPAPPAVCAPSRSISALADPLGQDAARRPAANAQLASQDWTPPTSAPAIKHLWWSCRTADRSIRTSAATARAPPGTGEPPLLHQWARPAARRSRRPCLAPRACADPESDTDVPARRLSGVPAAQD